MKRKLVALTLAVLMAVSLIPLARAAGLPFKDVPQSQWYYNDVVQAYESGLVDGISATTFGPDQSMTYAQAVKLAACMHQTRAEGAVSLTVGEDPWYSTYVDYCKANNIISKDYRWNGKATRAGYAEIFAAAMPDLAQKNTVVDNAVPDVKTSHPQAGGHLQALPGRCGGGEHQGRRGALLQPRLPHQAGGGGRHPHPDDERERPAVPDHGQALYRPRQARHPRDPGQEV